MPADGINLTTRRKAARDLALRLLARSWTLESIARTVKETLDKAPSRTRAALVVRVYELGEDSYPPSPHYLTNFILHCNFFDPKPGHVITAVLAPPIFAPRPSFSELAVPALPTPGQLAAWLALSAEELDWFSDDRNGQRNARSSQLLHYHHILAPKPSGPPRLLEAPKARLKAIQRRILRDILSHVPVHGRVHGFVAGRSCLTGAQIHASEAVVVNYDLEEFFPSLTAARIHGIFRSIGYPWAVARHLTGLCTTATPAGVIDSLVNSPADRTALRATYGVPHLPQGAPSSPALANLLSWKLDMRLHGLARAAGANYTRYADDLAFSGDAGFAKSLNRFGRGVATIVDEEGFRLNNSKTRIMLRHVRQQVTGVIINEHCSVGRAEFDQLKAILHNCMRKGPENQNRGDIADFRQHLVGKIAWVEQIDPRRGAKLRAIFERIEWGAQPAF